MTGPAGQADSPCVAEKPLHVLVYVSAATREFAPSEMRDLLDVARRYNTAAGITGLLLYHRGGFMQALEGERSAIERLLDRIRIDPRHRDLIVVLRQPRVRREFAEWAMGYVDLTQAPVPDGFSPLLDDPMVREAYAKTPDRVHHLLLHYARVEADVHELPALPAPTA